MSRLYLVRHARPVIDPAVHHSQWQLDPIGQGALDQMAALPHWGSAERIVSSPEPKARKTAEAIAARHGLPAVEIVDALRELHKASFAPDHDAVMARLFAEPDQPAAEGWEPASAALARFSAAMAELVGAAAGRDLIVVSHGTVLSLYLAQLAGQERVDLAEWAAIGLPDYCVVDVETLRVVQPFGAWR